MPKKHPAIKIIPGITTPVKYEERGADIVWGARSKYSTACPSLVGRQAGAALPLCIPLPTYSSAEPHAAASIPNKSAAIGNRLAQAWRPSQQEPSLFPHGLVGRGSPSFPPRWVFSFNANARAGVMPGQRRCQDRCHRPHPQLADPMHHSLGPVQGDVRRTKA